ncbi:unnamed protein product [Linum trigynum]|uniref:Reverse transcriptase domain-containing protein n=1 Tax=Linum trigynum TaxID=586398 RepID=A0AAV2GSH8_9ROSI
MAIILPSIISPEQNGFMRGLQIVDNVLIGHEVMHYLKVKKQGKKGYLTLKVDMGNVYDRVEWYFLLAIMAKMGFSHQWVGWVQECVLTVTFSVMMNGTPIGYFRSTRWLRQGDPLSPLLFAGVKISPQGPIISHLFFADDSYLFLQASKLECETLLKLLQDYQDLSDQKMNLSKYVVCFSGNVDPPNAEEMAFILGVGEISLQDRYMGIPCLVKHFKVETFRYLEERLLAKLQGKEVLLKAVVVALPIYVMSCFLLPVTLCRKLDKHMTRFGGAIRWRKSRLTGSPGRTYVGVSSRVVLGSGVLEILPRLCWLKFLGEFGRSLRRLWLVFLRVSTLLELLFSLLSMDLGHQGGGQVCCIGGIFFASSGRGRG